MKQKEILSVDSGSDLKSEMKDLNVNLYPKQPLAGYNHNEPINFITNESDAVRIFEYSRKPTESNPATVGHKVCMFTNLGGKYGIEIDVDFANTIEAGTPYSGVVKHEQMNFNGKSWVKKFIVLDTVETKSKKKKKRVVEEEED